MLPRDRILRLLNREKIDRIPCFSGTGNVTAEGMKRYNIKFAEAHKNAEKMALLAASSYKLFGYECAVVPFDLGLEAEALGCTLNFYENREILYPTVKTKISRIPKKFQNKRIKIVAKAIKLLKEDIGNKVAIGSYVLGPFTLAGQIMELSELLKKCIENPATVKKILNSLVNPIKKVADELKKAGADYITIREMGASSSVIGPKMFESLVMPSLMKTIKEIPSPKILHVCGDANPVLELMYKCNDAISVDQRTDIAKAREKIEDAIILGNIDPLLLARGTPAAVKNAVKKAAKEGVSGIMPGCDILPATPKENMKAMIEAAKSA